jgi:hypothetical protein
MFPYVVTATVTEPLGQCSNNHCDGGHAVFSVGLEGRRVGIFFNDVKVPPREASAFMGCLRRARCCKTSCKAAPAWYISMPRTNFFMSSLQKNKEPSRTIEI